MSDLNSEKSNELRKIALELYALDGRNVVKTANVFKKIRNWFKAKTDPEFAENVARISNESTKVKQLTEQLGKKIEIMQKAIADSDVALYGQMLEQIKYLSGELSKELGSYQDTAQENISKAPVETVQEAPKRQFEYDEPNELESVQKGFKRDKDVLNKLYDQLPEGLDVHIGTVGRNIQEFDWFKQFSVNDIYISAQVADAIIQAVSKLVARSPFLGLTFEEAGSLVENTKEGFFENFKQLFLNGYLYSYDFSPVSKEIKNRPANQMQMKVSVQGVNIPGTNIFIDFPIVGATDLMASLRPSKKISIGWAKNIRISPGTEKQQYSGGHGSPLKKNEPKPVNEQLDTLKKEIDYDHEHPKFDRELDEVIDYDDGRYDYGDDYDDRYADDGLDKKAQMFGQQFSGSSNIHVWARNVLIEAFRRVMRREPTINELQTVQSIALLETHYGRGWKGAGKVSNNWGAIQCCQPKNGVCPTNSFMYTDTSPQKDGTSKKYSVCFKSYATPVDGAADLIKELFISKKRGVGLLNAASQGSIQGISEVMYDTGYYEGFGKDRNARVSNHMKAVSKAVNTITTALNEPKSISPNQPILNQQFYHQVPMNDQLHNDYEDLMRKLLAAGPIEALVRKAIEEEILPRSHVLLVVRSAEDSFASKIKYSKILTAALREEIGAETSLHSNGSDLEIECDVVGNIDNVNTAVKAVADGISEAFKLATKNTKNIKIDLYNNQNSMYDLLNSDTIKLNLRKFAMEMNLIK